MHELRILFQNKKRVQQFVLSEQVNFENLSFILIAFITGINTQLIQFNSELGAMNYLLTTFTILGILKYLAPFTCWFLNYMLIGLNTPILKYRSLLHVGLIPIKYLLIFKLLILPIAPNNEIYSGVLILITLLTIILSSKVLIQSVPVVVANKSTIGTSILVLSYILTYLFIILLN